LVSLDTDAKGVDGAGSVKGISLGWAVAIIMFVDCVFSRSLPSIRNVKVQVQNHYCSLEDVFT